MGQGLKGELAFLKEQRSGRKRNQRERRLGRAMGMAQNLEVKIMEVLGAASF